ncbi:MAG: winged helix-turn-helix transcriptional regulator [Rhizobiales bacterium]|nr:winged helix-turn-helix transcriptional regulator [Hyphomicrobiales bacterium]
MNPYTQSLLLYAYQGSAGALVETLRARGHPAIRPKHGAVFANIERQGTRPSAMAERAGIGKAAMGELIDELQRLGYVRREPDPSDRRAKLVVPTDAAVEVTNIVHEFNMNLETTYRELLGEEAYQALRAALQAIAPRNEMQPRLPPDT